LKGEKCVLHRLFPVVADGVARIGGKNAEGADFADVRDHHFWDRNFDFLCGRITVRTFHRGNGQRPERHGLESGFYRMQAAPPKGLTRSALSIVSTETTMVV
jgi:hypothetical protein